MDQNRCSRESVERYGVDAVRIGGDIKPPKKLVDVPPEFPELPEGTTVLGMWMGELLVEPDGSVADVWSTREIKVNPPFPPFNEAILEAMRQWEYEPVTVDGEGMPVCMTVTINITLS